MKHYEDIEWKKYLSKQLPVAVRIEMEDHLLSCEQCLELYLLELEEAGLNINEYVLPSNFADSVMDNLNTGKFARNNGAKYKRNILVCYVSAACITLFLMASGAFNLAFKTIPSTTALISKSSLKFEHSLGKLRLNNIFNLNFKLINILKEN